MTNRPDQQSDTTIRDENWCHAQVKLVYADLNNPDAGCAVELAIEEVGRTDLGTYISFTPDYAERLALQLLLLSTEAHHLNKACPAQATNRRAILLEDA